MYHKESGQSWRENPLEFVEWFEQNHDRWASSTFRLYKASLIYYMSNNGPIESVRKLELIEYNDGGQKKRTTKTSGKKLKYVDRSDLEKIKKNIRGSYAKLISLWLDANLLVGLRPIEWKLAILDENKLIIKNAKTTNNRGNGDSRTLTIGHLSLSNQDIIRNFLDELHNKMENKSFTQIYNNCRVLLKRECKRLWPRRANHITLYSTRHQFTSDIKGISSKIEVAAALGHKTTRTAYLHYAQSRKKSKGKGKDNNELAIPDKENIMTVEQKESFLDSLVSSPSNKEK